MSTPPLKWGRSRSSPNALTADIEGPFWGEAWAAYCAAPKGGKVVAFKREL